MTPNINAYTKTYNINERIRPVINNIHAPLYKVAKCLNKKTKMYSMLTKYREEQKLIWNSTRTKIFQINGNNKMIPLDIKDLYVNLDIKTFST